MKEHKAFVAEQYNVEKLQGIVAQQQKQINELTAGLQKVSAQLAAGRVRSIGGLEASKFSKQIVTDNQ